MNDRLPPLNSLRAFEAAARHLSLRKAAEELHVTPGAISHQVKALEDYLGIALFRRLTRGLELTEAAKAGLPQLREAFTHLAKAVQRLRASEAAGILTVGVAPAFAVKWLVPRLPHLATAHPQIQLRISARLELIDVLRHVASNAIDNLHANDDDLMIRFGNGQYPGYRVNELCSGSVTPLCSPALLKGNTPLKTPDDLRHQTLLHDNTVYLDDERPDWSVWLEAAGVEKLDATRGPRFNHTALAVEAAADGLGVALSLPKLAASELASGRLVTPFSLSLPSKFSYYLVCAEGRAERPIIVDFRNWLLERMGS